MNVAELVTASIILLVVATVVALLSRWLRVSYVVGLVLAGLAVTALLPKTIGLKRFPNFESVYANSGIRGGY